MRAHPSQISGESIVLGGGIAAGCAPPKVDITSHLSPQQFDDDVQHSGFAHYNLVFESAVTTAPTSSWW